MTLQTFAMRMAAIAAFGTTLVACGGGGGGGGGSSPASSAPTSTAVPAAPAAATTAPGAANLATPAATPDTPVSSIIGALTDAISPGTSATTAATTTAYSVFGVVTDVRIQNTSAAAQATLPVTFGQVFAVGDMQPADSLVGRFENGSTIPLQLDVKATHPDGSVRHAVVSGMVADMAANETRTLSLMKSNAPHATGLGPKALLMNGFSASVHATVNGVRYDASADDIIKMGGAYRTWLSGAVANEWHVSAPLTTADGVAHPHLTARFAIRWYDAIKKARVDVTIENAWAYEPNPQNFTYDAEVKVRGEVVYAKPGLIHFNQSRWRKMFWWGGDASQAYVKHNTAYLIATRALPNYDQSVVVPEATLAGMKTRWTGPITEPMNIGVATAYMPGTGGRDDLGMLPGWAAIYLLSMDARAKQVTLGTADLAGTWSAHYRDKNTDRPVSLMDYPYMTVYGNPTDTRNPATRLYEAFPKCAVGATCGSSTYRHDTAHQPAFAYLPYLVTGDYYYLEELQFWGMYNAFQSNPGYRNNIDGLLSREQVRGQGWSMRTLGEAAYITPDNDRLKSHFTRIVTKNLEWYNTTYTNNTAANAFAVLDMGSAVIYNSGRGIAPWQDDFFTAAIGHVAELGFSGAGDLLRWKAKAPLMRMGDPGMCWIDASLYSMNIRDAGGAMYTTMAQAWTASRESALTSLACNSVEMAAYLKQKVGEMVGYASSTAGYPSNMQPALAYSVDAGLPNSAAAWAKFMNRSVKPNYGLGPQFAIVPR